MKKWECTVCGYIHVGDEPPEECPVCSADKSMFVEVVEAQAGPAEGTAHPKTHQAAPPGAKQPILAAAYSLAAGQIVKHHLHPIAVHTPNGVLPMALIFFFITALWGYPLFETAALFSCIFVLLSMPLVLFTGYVAWQKLYRGALTPIFKIKISASLATVLLLLALILWRAVQPEIVTAASTGRWVFLALAVLLVGAVGLAGHMGGKLVFGSRRG